MIKTGIIGLGAIGQRLIKQFESHPETEIAAVCDCDRTLAQQVSESLGSIPFFSDYKEMLETAELDLVYVAVPPKHHHGIAASVMDRGIHILCEKPLANSLEEAEDLFRKSQGKKLVSAMNFPLNYSAGARTFANLIRSEYIGKLRRVELHMRFPQWPRAWQQNNWVASREQGGFVLEVGIHFIQQIHMLFGPLTVKNRSLEFPEDKLASEQGIVAELSLGDGTPVIINGLSGIAGSEEIRLTAYGTEGTLSLLNWSDLEGGKLGEPLAPIEQDSSFNEALIDHVVRALKGEESIIIGFSEGFQAQTVLEQLRN
ncbi:Gfo/Idh/MocA family protein [Peribacillus sp. B-H-3]|uniref:Gfo/Idh/MocA family protein n=1 Tax=Peribacillus sp. B-H-3 TaxID=3400420 RepID=UPI003B02C1FE